MRAAKIRKIVKGGADYRPEKNADSIAFALNSLVQDLHRLLVVAHTSTEDTFLACSRYDALKADILSLSERYGVSVVVSDYIVEMERMFEVEALRPLKRQDLGSFNPPDQKLLFIRPAMVKFLKTTV